MQLEGDVARQDLRIASQRCIQNRHANFQRLEKTFFLGLQHSRDALLIGLQPGIGRAHQRAQVCHQLVEKRRFLAQLVAVADGAADDASLYIPTAFVGRVDAVADEKCGGADVVGDDKQRFVAQVFLAGFARGGLDQRVKNVNFVVAVHMLQDGGQALQAHAGVHAGRGQVAQRAVGLHVELHEHVVPDLDVAVAILLGRAGRAAGNVRAVVVEDFAAGAAGAGVGHHPEVVAGIFGALVVADAHHAFGRQADLLRPDVISLVIVDVDRGPELVGRQLVDLGQQLPGPLERLAFEVVTKAPVAEHLEEGVVACGVADVFQVVVLAAGAQAGLHRCRAHVRALVGAEEHILELHHARVGEHQGRVVARHERARRHHGVPLRREEVQEALADVGNSDGGAGSGCAHVLVLVWRGTAQGMRCLVCLSLRL